MKFVVLAAFTTSLLAFASGASAGDITFPGETSFTFSGYSGIYKGVSNTPMLEVCANNLGTCHESPGDAHAGLSDRVLARFLDQRVAGAAIRGDIYQQDPGGSAVYHSLEFELVTDNFFTQNPGAHISIGPRSLLPYQVNGTQYNNYPAFPYLSGTTIKVPYAYGDGIILGNVPCKSAPGAGYLGVGNVSNGIAEEIFINPANPHDITACPQSQISFENNATYLVKVFVRQEQCPHKNALCRWIGYRLQKTGAVFGPTGPTKAGNTNFIDDTAQPAVFGGGPTVAPAGWTSLWDTDRSSWFIAHTLTSKTNRWSFRVKNLQAKASNIAPAWWTSP